MKSNNVLYIPGDVMLVECLFPWCKSDITSPLGDVMVVGDCNGDGKGMAWMVHTVSVLYVT